MQLDGRAILGLKKFNFRIWAKIACEINENDENKQMLVFLKTKHVKQGNYFCENVWRHKIFADLSKIFVCGNMWRQEQMHTQSWRNWLFCKNLTYFREDKKRELIFANMEMCPKNFAEMQYKKRDFANFREISRNWKKHFCFNPRWRIEVRALLCRWEELLFQCL